MLRALILFCFSGLLLAGSAGAQDDATTPAEAATAAPLPSEPAAPSPLQDEAAKPAPRLPRIAVSVRMMTQDEVTRAYDIGRLSDEEKPDRLERRKLSTDGVHGMFVGPTLLFTGVKDTVSSSGAAEGAPWGFSGGYTPTTPTSTTIFVGAPAAFELQVRLETVRRALLEAEFPGFLGEALRKQAPAARYDGDPPEGILVTMAFYGLRNRNTLMAVQNATDDYCFVALGSAFPLVAGGSGRPVEFLLGVTERSKGMAEPACASFLEFSERGAFRLRQVMQQSAGNVAEWLVGKVLGGR